VGSVGEEKQGRPIVTPLAGHSLAGAAAPDCDATGVDRPHPRRAGIQIETIPEKSVLGRSFGKISSMVTFNVTSRTPSSALDDSEPTLLLFNRGPGAVLVGVTEIFDRAKAMLLQPRRAARLDVTEGRITVVPAAPGSYSILDVVVEAQRTLSSECASVRADRPVEPGAWGCRFAWFRRVAARLHRKSVDAGQDT
jgi:hypothetical protein